MKTVYKKATICGEQMVAGFDSDGNCLNIKEKPEHPKSNYAVVGGL